MKQLKARVQNLEKSYEVLKCRHKESETEKTRLATENTKLLEEMAKLKSAKLRLNKEVQDLKASQVTAATANQENASKNAAMALDELEKSQHYATAANTLSSASSLSTINGKAKVPEDSVSGSAV